MQAIFCKYPPPGSAKKQRGGGCLACGTIFVGMTICRINTSPCTVCLIAGGCRGVRYRTLCVIALCVTALCVCALCAVARCARPHARERALPHRRLACSMHASVCALPHTAGARCAHARKPAGRRPAGCRAAVPSRSGLTVALLFGSRRWRRRGRRGPWLRRPSARAGRRSA